MKTITVTHGISRSVTKEFPDSATIQDILNDTIVQGAVSPPENPRVLVDGESANLGDVPENGEEISVERQSSTKG